MDKNYTELTTCAINTANALCSFSKKFPKVRDLEEMNQATTEALCIKERMADGRMIDKCLRIYIAAAMESNKDTDLPMIVYQACKKLVLFAKKWDAVPSSDEEWKNCINQMDEVYKKLSSEEETLTREILNCYMALLEN